MRLVHLAALTVLTVSPSLVACDESASPPPAADTAVGADIAFSDAPPVSPDMTRGQAVYTQDCSFCHGPDARSGTAREDLPGKSEAAIREAVRNGKSGMPSFGIAQIDDAALADLVAYIQSL